MTETTERRALLDTSIQIDRKKMPGREEYLEKVLRDYDLTIATGISLMEFKAVLIQQLITIHNQLKRKGARFSRARDALVEKDHPQRALRVHIFNNLIGVWGCPRDAAEDERSAVKARLAIENIIQQVYLWFKEESAHVFLNKTRIDCTRAEEAPVKRQKAQGYDVNLPKCLVGKNRYCRVEEFIRTEGGRDLLLRLELLPDDPEKDTQLIKSRGVLKSVIENDNVRLSVDECRSAGDCLIVLEGKDAATDALSTNAREWQRLCEWTGLNFHRVRYPDEETKS